MGIKGLMRIINDNAPSAVKETKISSYTGRVVAIDASMAIYQFLVRSLSNVFSSTTKNSENVSYRSPFVQHNKRVWHRCN